MVRQYALLAVLAASITGCSTPVFAPAPLEVALVNLGEVDIDVQIAAERALRDNYNVVIEVRDADLPKDAFYEPRSRYRADKILDFLEDKYQNYDRVVALTSVDISTTKGVHEDWGVFGLGRRPGKPCVVSTFRLKKEGAEKMLERVNKVVLHEFGHTVGLPHCEASETCPMQDAEGKVATVDKSNKTLCKSCLDLAGDVTKERAS